MDYVLQTNGLTKSYKKTTALDGLTMHVPKGSIYGFVGRNGAGKTTLFRLICGLQKPSSGSFTLYGIHNDSEDIMKARRRMGAVIEKPAVYIVSCIACILIYMIVTAFSAGIGRFFFENNVDSKEFFIYFLLGIGMSLAIGCLFSVITVLCGNKTQAIIWCMGLAFGMLFLCLHTNEVLVQPEYKNGIFNPHYVGGIRRMVYGILHDLNPCGQAAQLSGWEVWHPVRIVLIDLLLIIGLTILGCRLFEKKDIN